MFKREVVIEANREKIRDSILLHLESWQSFGVQDVLRQPSPQTVLSPEASSIPVAEPDKPDQLADCQKLSDIQAVIGDCKRCKLHAGRKNIVFGVGNPNAELMFIGEGPGADEDLQGLPFVGRAGQLLTKMIQAMGYQRDEVYIANVVKCRPPENRNPEPDEILSCSPFLKKQIDLVKPKVIVVLGKFAAQTICETQIPISKLRGQFRTVNGTPVMPTFHPSFLLRNPEMKRPVWEDLQKVMQLLQNKPTSSGVSNTPNT